ncbi:MAG: glycosyltransferase family 2 protein, partial [Ruminococcus sp.]|nr:glycosyltransferase family 2 protein [Ruminococcus sp.]
MVCVSVIMPAYNAQNTIKQAIDSVLAQTFGDFELIVINDHSTDDTRNIIMNYQSNDKRVLLVDNEINSGVSFSRNKGIEVAQGR